jgi:hypothetical protein
LGEESEVVVVVVVVVETEREITRLSTERSYPELFHRLPDLQAVFGLPQNQAATAGHITGPLRSSSSR